jgi:hypothetical protein
MTLTRWTLAVCFVVLNGLDVWTTRKALALGGRELNPVVRFFMNRGWFVPAKTCMVLAVLLVLALVEEEIAVYTGATCCGIYVLVVWNNLCTIRRQSRR